MNCECLRTKGKEAEFEVSQLHEDPRSRESTEEQMRDEAQAWARMDDEGCPDRRPQRDPREDGMGVGEGS
jgi:hypothetical protein